MCWGGHYLEHIATCHPTRKTPNSVKVASVYGCSGALLTLEVNVTGNVMAVFFHDFTGDKERVHVVPVM